MTEFLGPCQLNDGQQESVRQPLSVMQNKNSTWKTFFQFLIVQCLVKSTGSRNIFHN